MKAKTPLTVLAAGIALSATGCGTMQMTSILDPDHHPDQSQLVVLRFTFKEQPEHQHYTGHRASEADMLQMDETLIAGNRF